MSNRTTLILSLVLIAAAVALSLAVYGRLPQPMASHWGTNDEVNGTISRFWGAFLMPLLALAMLGLFLLIPAIDPLKANIAKFRGTFNAFIVAADGLPPVRPRADHPVEPGRTELPDEHRAAAGRRADLHLRRRDDAPGQAQLLHRHPHPVDAVQRPGVGRDAPRGRAALTSPRACWRCSARSCPARSPTGWCSDRPRLVRSSSSYTRTYSGAASNSLTRAPRTRTLGTWHLGLDTWHLTPGTWHLTLRT